MTAHQTHTRMPERSQIDRVVDALARVPVPVIAAGLVVGAVLGDLDVALTSVPGADEPAQWIGRIGVKLYWLILPLTFLAMWSRRRDHLGRVGRAGALLITPQVPAYLLLMVSTLLWGLVLGRDDLPRTYQVLIEEVPATLFYVGIVVLAVAFLLRRGSRLVGALLLAGLALSFGPPGLLSVVFVLLAGVVLKTGVGGRPTATY